MTILINKEFVTNKINSLLAKAELFLEKSGNTAEEKKEFIEDMFLSSHDVATKIERMVEEDEAVIAEDLDIVLIQHMRADALADILSKIE